MQLKFYIVFSIVLSILSILGNKYSVGMIEYPLFFIFIIFSFINSSKSFVLIKKYMNILFLFISLLILNSFVSEYTDSPIYALIGSVITLLPFLLFLISYNYKFTFSQINLYVDIWICIVLSLCFIAYCETYILGTVKLGNALLSISILKFGFFASLCNQGLIFSLYRYSITHRNKYLLAILFLTFSIFLFVQLKVIIGSIIIYILYFLYIIKMAKFKKRIYLCVMIFVSVLIVISVDVISSKIDRYIGMYGDKYSYENIARTALYYQAFNMSNDFFPIGTGQGTYGSIPVNMRYSQVYYDYRLSQVGGLGKDSEEDYKMDTHWASILGENGYLGTIIYLMLFFFPLRYLKRTKLLRFNNSIKFLLMTPLIVMMIEATVLSIPTRFCFMFIYAGLNAIICRYITEYNKSIKPSYFYESFASNN